MALTFIEIFIMGIGAGIVGSILGLGGGIIIVPALTIIFGLPIKNAVAVSTVSIIATSTGAAVAYLRDRITNTRVAIWLEMGTSAGALSGALVAGIMNQRVLYILFGSLLAYSGYGMFKSRNLEKPASLQPDRLAEKLRLGGSYYDKALGHQVEYQVHRTFTGLVLMYFSGIAAGLLGIGAGIFKVPAMDQVMGMPFKASTATSNFMIGVTAASGAVVYFARGDVKPLVAGPVVLGVLLGAIVGAKFMVRMKPAKIRVMFIPLIAYTALEMIYRGVKWW
ncbi:sulfite exporter TauE/SafE family protein [Geomesophilobacter sediminis]|uniref:Probable membrane transporter protein n=1 Tax=Geomesophilobacter sediminis TaxID=2798584 RepID=A0A8J7J6H6_9BACT|nr:sulfite exporter TauE/SafE family protein [Geomesophilobacter sediminis]MBJ6724406.1 sulfite exporter TauE/SafE family protein [Geomesophilobacter sediminis]